MTSKIIIKSDEKIICPKCSHEFNLDEGIAKQTIERYQEEYIKDNKKLKNELNEEAKKKIEKANKMDEKKQQKNSQMIRVHSKKD